MRWKKVQRRSKCFPKHSSLCAAVRNIRTVALQSVYGYVLSHQSTASKCWQSVGTVIPCLRSVYGACISYMRYWPSVRWRWLDIGQVLFRGQYLVILNEQAWSIKDLLYGQKVTPKNFAFAATKRQILSLQDRPILPARVANQSTGFASTCPLG